MADANEIYELLEQQLTMIEDPSAEQHSFAEYLGSTYYFDQGTSQVRTIGDAVGEITTSVVDLDSGVPTLKYILIDSNQYLNRLTSQVDNFMRDNSNRLTMLSSIKSNTDGILNCLNSGSGNGSGNGNTTGDVVSIDSTQFTQLTDKIEREQEICANLLIINLLTMCLVAVILGTRCWAIVAKSWAR